MRSLATSGILAALVAGAALVVSGAAGTIGANASGSTDPQRPGPAPTATAVPTTSSTGAPTSPGAAFKIFDAMVSINGCSGSIVRFPDSRDSDKALILTNGHCVQPMPDPGKFVTALPAKTKATVLKGDVATSVTDIEVDHIVYATMTGTDIGLYSGTVTYAQLKGQGVEARPMATVRPKQGTRISIPSGAWKENYTCTMDESVHELHEGGYVWKDSFRHRCDTIHGTSGAPVVDQATGAVIGINNTGNDIGEGCGFGSPCEVDEHGKTTVTKGQKYGQQTYHIDTCFRKGTIDLAKDGCRLVGAKGVGGDPAPRPNSTVTSAARR